ncbi:MAG: class I SAM-dependent methyltransferase [Bacteroidales bacterium]|nr:class I SAM-dependent methyltransferase [Bacteroidales bacterium]
MNCKICGNTTNKLFCGNIMNKYTAEYLQCSNCEFIFIKDAFWLEESYSEAISCLDTGLLYRNIMFSNLSEKIIFKLFNINGIYLDYGGGYGIFVRLMRDKGLNFFRQDKYAKNLFAKYFDISDNKGKNKFDLVTAFELFEHLPEPITEIENILQYSKNILFSTELYPKDNFQNWWYLVQESGQHISFYNIKTLKYIAEKFNLFLYSNYVDLHLFSKQNLNIQNLNDIFTAKKEKLTLIQKIRQKTSNIIWNKRETISNPILKTLRDKDYNYIKSILNNK